MPYDFWLSPARLRWGAGRLDMEEAIARHAYGRGGGNDRPVSAVRGGARHGGEPREELRERLGLRPYGLLCRARARVNSAPKSRICAE